MSKELHNQTENEINENEKNKKESSDTKIPFDIKENDTLINSNHNDLLKETVQIPEKKSENENDLNESKLIISQNVKQSLTIGELKNELRELNELIEEEKKVKMNSNKNNKKKNRSTSAKIINRNISLYSNEIDINIKYDDINNNKTLNKDNKILNDVEINEKLINMKINLKKDCDEIISDINLLLSKKVIIEKIVDYEYFTCNDFQIMNNKETEKLPFIINLFNYINILNCLFLYSSENIELFHKLLLLINSKFTYVERDEKSKIIDFGFLTNISSLIIPYIISKGETGFNNSELNFLSKKYAKNHILDYGYLFEKSNKEYLFNEIEKDNYIEYPTIIYYLNSSGVEKLYKEKIFNFPISYIINDKKDGGDDFSGYNEFDICFKMKENIKIEQNKQFNIIKLNNGNIINNYKKNKEALIEFKKDIIYIIEVKKNSDDLVYNSWEKILRKKDTFIQLYKNVIYDKLIIENNSNFELLFICNKNRKNVVNNVKKLNLNNSVFFSNPNISLNVISSLQSNIYELNVRNNILKNDIDLLKKDKKLKDEQIKNLVDDKLLKDKKITEHQTLINEMKKQLEQLTNRLNSLNNNNEINLGNSNDTIDINSINLNNAKENYSRFINLLNDLKMIEKYPNLCLKDIINDKLDEVKNRIKVYYTTYNECSAEYFKINDDACNISGAIINNLNKKIDKNNETIQYIFNYFEKKIKSSNYKELFIALKEMTFGIGVKKLSDCSEINISFNNIDVINNIISYVFMLESEKNSNNIIYKFYCAIIYFAMNFYDIYTLKKLIGDDLNNIQFIIRRIISSINDMNLKIYLS